MNLLKKHFKKILFIYFISIFLIAYSVGYFVAQPTEGHITISSVGIVWGDMLHLEVVPNGYPVVGESWIIFVYNYSSSSGKVSLKACPNASVLVTVKLEDESRTYDLSVNDEGQTTFSYQPEYIDIAFQAFRGESESRKVVISEHYISSEIVNYLTGINGFISLVSAITFTLKREKIGRILRLMVIGLICLFSFITASSLYSKFFQGTTWGYPEKIFGNILTFTVLEYATIIGFIMLVIITILSYLLRSKDSK